MHRLTGEERKCLKRRKGLTSSIRGVSHFTRRTKRRLYFKLQLWMWRKRQKKSSFALFRAKKQACGGSPRLAEKTHKRQKACQPGGPSSSSLQGHVPEGDASAPAAQTGGPAGAGESTDLPPNARPRLNTDHNARRKTPHDKETRTLEPSERSEADGCVDPAFLQTDPNGDALTKEIHGRYSSVNG